MPIRHAEMQFQCSLEEFRVRALSRKALRHGQRVPGLDQVSPLELLPAVVNHGRWIVHCPCGNVEFAWLRPQLLMCSSCWNQYAVGRWRRISFPKERQAIEAVLSVRPFPKNRNWVPGETVEDLIVENNEHGLSAGGEQ